MRFSAITRASGASTSSNALAFALTQPGRSTTTTGADADGADIPVNDLTCASAVPARTRRSATAARASLALTAGPAFASRRAVAIATSQSTSRGMSRSSSVQPSRHGRSAGTSSRPVSGSGSADGAAAEFMPTRYVQLRVPDRRAFDVAVEVAGGRRQLQPQPASRAASWSLRALGVERRRCGVTASASTTKINGAAVRVDDVAGERHDAGEVAGLGPDVAGLEAALVVGESVAERCR